MSSRLQLALNVTDLDAAIGFYSRLFTTSPHKVRPGYANFAIDEPPLKLVLIENSGAAGGSLNHLGVEVATSADVAEATDRLAAAGLATDTRQAELCCHAVQDKVWVTGADGEPWEIYTVVDDAPEPSARDLTLTACCA